MRLLPILLLSACAGSPRPTATAPAKAWRDATKHEVRMVPVADGVSLEVLDFGGTGNPLVLLAGLGNSGHVFDDLAPALTSKHHVYAITRRGHGVSSAPDGGYDVATRVADDVAVLDALGLARAVLVGHSMAGDELTGIAGQHPERVIAVIYLDAASDQLTAGDAEGMPALPLPPPGAPPVPEDLISPESVRHYVTGLFGVELPMGEILAMFQFDPDWHYVDDRVRPEVGEHIIAGTTHPDYTRIQCPALALYVRYSSPQVALGERRWQALDDEGRAAWTAGFPQVHVLEERAHEQVRRDLRGVRIIEYLDSNHYVFIVDQAKVVADIDGFLAER